MGRDHRSDHRAGQRLRSDRSVQHRPIRLVAVRTLPSGPRHDRITRTGPTGPAAPGFIGTVCGRNATTESRTIVTSRPGGPHVAYRLATSGFGTAGNIPTLVARPHSTAAGIHSGWSRLGRRRNQRRTRTETRRPLAIRDRRSTNATRNAPQRSSGIGASFVRCRSLGGSRRV